MLPAFETGRMPPVNFVNQLAVSSGSSVILSLLQEPGALLSRKGHPVDMASYGTFVTGGGIDPFI